MERVQRGDGAEFAETQAAEWRTTNAELMKLLTGVLDSPQSRELASSIAALKDRFVAELRTLEVQLHTNQRDLIGAAENGDFIKASLLSRTLVALKARVQATQAVHHELECVGGPARAADRALPATDGKDESDARTNVSSIFQAKLGKVLPLRARS